jgi:hypothetical protein
MNNTDISGNKPVRNTVKVKSKAYHLEAIEVPYCNNDNLIIFGRAHMSYINQIFGDETIRDIIQEVFLWVGSLLLSLPTKISNIPCTMFIIRTKTKSRYLN